MNEDCRAAKQPEGLRDKLSGIIELSKECAIVATDITVRVFGDSPVNQPEKEKVNTSIEGLILETRNILTETREVLLNLQRKL